MGFWIFMMLMDLMIPLSMIGFGKLFLKCAPKEINPLFGYRTSMSMKNQDTWQFAHAYFGKCWLKLGWILIPPSVIAMLFVWNADKDPVGFVGGGVCMVQCIVMLVPIFFTERVMRRHFDRNGKRRDKETGESREAGRQE